MDPGSGRRSQGDTNHRRLRSRESPTPSRGASGCKVVGLIHSGSLRHSFPQGTGGAAGVEQDRDPQGAATRAESRDAAMRAPGCPACSLQPNRALHAVHHAGPAGAEPVGPRHLRHSVEPARRTQGTTPAAGLADAGRHGAVRSGGVFAIHTCVSSTLTHVSGLSLADGPGRVRARHDGRQRAGVQARRCRPDAGHRRRAAPGRRGRGRLRLRGAPGRPRRRYSSSAAGSPSCPRCGRG